MTAAPRLRVVFFGSSIVSDWRNPLATSARPILAALVAMGHEVLFLEERRNQWLTRMLKTRGSGPERAFSAAYPAIHHRTYDLPKAGNARRVWFAQQVGTADAIIALPGLPTGVLGEIVAFDSKIVARGIHASLGEMKANLCIGPANHVGVDAHFGPAVDLLSPQGNEERSGVVLVAYERELGERAQAILAAVNPILIDQAPEKTDDWLYIPEVNLSGFYDRFETAVVAGDWSDELTWARALLPAARGCAVVAFGPNAGALAGTGATLAADLAALLDIVRASAHDPSAGRMPEKFDARRQAQALISAISQAKSQK